MLFNLKSIVLYGLLTVATASPILSTAEHVTSTQLETRMTKKKGVTQSFTSLTGEVITTEQITAALRTVRHHRAAGTRRGRYPEPFSNRVANNGVHRPVFPDRQMGDQSGLLEYPILLPGDVWPGSIRIVTTSGAVPNFVGVMQHPLGLERQFRQLHPAPETEECHAESSTGGNGGNGRPRNPARDLWELVKRKATGKKTKPATGKACALKPKPKPKTPTKKPTKKPAKKPSKKPTKTPTKKPTKPAKKPAKKRPGRTSRKGGRKGGKRG